MKQLPAIIRFCIVGTGLFFSLTSMALLNDKTQTTTYIQSDSASYNYKTGTDTYRGHVKILQGTTQLLGNIVMIYHLPNHSIDKIIAEGEPAQYTLTPSGHSHQVEAQAERIEFYPNKNKILFIGKGKILDNKNLLTGPLIEYQTNTQTIITLPSKQASSNIVLQP